MLSECRSCGALVDATERCQYEGDEPDFGLSMRYTLCSCPRCTSPILLEQYAEADGWSEPNRVFPPRDDQIGGSVPKAIRAAFEEAARCYESKSFTASAIMCRKTLEGVCVHHGVAERGLMKGLQRLQEQGV